MKTRLMLCPILIIRFFTITEACVAQNINKKFSNLNLLIGTWSMGTNKGTLYESWEKVNDSTLKSTSYKVNGKDTIFLEQVELVKRKGKIMYIPNVAENGNKPVVFYLVILENRTYTFENKQHDFPQRIIYRLPKDNKMYASIEGDINGHFKKSDFKYVKVF